MAAPLKVVFLTLYPIEAASTRHRVYENLRFLPADFQAEVLPGISSAALARLESSGAGRGARARFLLEEIGRKLSHLWRARRFDVIVVQKGLTVMSVRGFDRLLAVLGRPVVFDLDDAVYLGPPQVFRSACLRRLVQDPDQVKRLIRHSDRVVAGNRFLAAAVSAWNPRVSVVPTPVDPQAFVTGPRRHSGRLVVGWSGSGSTNRYVAALAPILAEVASAVAEVEFRVISSTPDGIPWQRFAGVRTSFVRWRLDSQAADLAALDVGLMPLEDDEWSRGKCGGKLLEYMAAGVPAVVSPVGVNAELLEDGVAGFLARAPPEWVERTVRLLRDPELRARMGQAAREAVDERHSCRVLAPRLAEAIRAAGEHGEGRRRGRRRGRT